MFTRVWNVINLFLENVLVSVLFSVMTLFGSSVLQTYLSIFYHQDESSWIVCLWNQQQIWYTSIYFKTAENGNQTCIEALSTCFMVFMRWSIVTIMFPSHAISYCYHLSLSTCHCFHVISDIRYNHLCDWISRKTTRLIQNLSFFIPHWVNMSGSAAALSQWCHRAIACNL